MDLLMWIERLPANLFLREQSEIQLSHSLNPRPKIETREAKEVIEKKKIGMLAREDRHLNEELKTERASADKVDDLREDKVFLEEKLMTKIKENLDPSTSIEPLLANSYQRAPLTIPLINTLTLKQSSSEQK